MVLLDSETILLANRMPMMRSTSACEMFFWNIDDMCWDSVLRFRGRDFFSDLLSNSNTLLKFGSSTVADFGSSSRRLFMRLHFKPLLLRCLRRGSNPLSFESTTQWTFGSRSRTRPRWHAIWKSSALLPFPSTRCHSTRSPKRCALDTSSIGTLFCPAPTKIRTRK